MRGNEFLDKMDLIDPAFIEAAATEPIKKKSAWVKWTAIAACMCVIIGVITFLRSAETGKITDDIPLSDTGMSKPVGEKNMENPDNANALNNEEETYCNKGVYIPPVKIPEHNENVQMDMLGLVVYNGGIYTQGETYIGDKAYEIEPLVGDYLGLATGSINEWSSQEAYEQEFASTIYGEVYTVNGYDSDFRICIRMEFIDENGEHSLLIEFLERLNGITLENGEDLFEDRLHIRNNIESVQWQSHEDWNWAKGNLHAAPFEDDAWSDFLDEVYQGEFVNTWMKDEAFYEDKPYSSIYDTPNQVHLYLNMNDSTTVELRLIEGGYVGLQTMGWYFVKIPGEAFDAIYNACEGTHIVDWVVAR